MQILKGHLVSPLGDPGSNPAGLQKKFIFQIHFFNFFWSFYLNNKVVPSRGCIENVSRPPKEANLTIAQAKLSMTKVLERDELLGQIFTNFVRFLVIFELKK